MGEMEKGYNYGRSSNYINRYSSKYPKTGTAIKKIDRHTLNTIVNQSIISACIAFIIIIIANFSFSFTNKIINSVKWTIETNYDFKIAVNNIKNKLLPDNKMENTNGKVEGIFGRTDAVNASSTNIASTSIASMIMPVSGAITSYFGMRKDPITLKQSQHYGVDIAGEKGLPIKAAQDGIVDKVEQTQILGRSVTLKHSGGLETIYGHCSEILVKKNQVIKQGDFIAKVGDTGIVTSSHLHFEVLKDGIQIDPLDMINSVLKSK